MTRGCRGAVVLIPSWLMKDKGVNPYPHPNDGLGVRTLNVAFSPSTGRVWPRACDPNEWAGSGGSSVCQTERLKETLFVRSWQQGTLNKCSGNENVVWQNNGNRKMFQPQAPAVTSFRCHFMVIARDFSSQGSEVSTELTAAAETRVGEAAKVSLIPVLMKWQ